MILSLITVNYHSDEDTLSLINDLEKCDIPSGIEIKVIVVDNSRSEEFKKTLESHGNLIYVDSPKGNIGFAAGNNLGIKKALEINSDLVILINNDTQAPKDLLVNILNSPIKDDNVGIVGGLIYFAKGFEYEDKYSREDLGKVIWYAGGKLDWNNVYGSHLGVNEVDKGQYSGNYDTDFVTGCLLITKRSILDKIGLLNEKYCLYHEDTDFNLRVKKAGFRLMVDTRIKLWHKVAQSSGIGSPLNDYFLTRNRLVLGMDYASARTKIALLREAFRKLFNGTPAQKQAIRDFFFCNLGKGSWLK
ncbi:MAG TPA: glycosyltransferase family 2 protein [Patescibacteria group bacterium]